MTFYNAFHSRFLFQVLIPICVCSVHVSDVKVIQHLRQGDLRRPGVLVTSAATWFIVALVVFMAASIQFYARWRRLRAEASAKA